MDCKTLAPTTIHFSQTGYFSKLILAWLEGHPALTPFYRYSAGIENFPEIIKNKGRQPVDRETLVQVLKAQYGPELLSTALEKRIEQLNRPDTFTVTTGHQLSLFGGPLYFFYKILTTINLARKIEEQNPENLIVPVFWMATEDHDFEEISQINLFGKELRWERAAGGPTGRMDPKENISSVLEELRTILGNSPEAGQLVALFEKAYTRQPNLAAATRYFVHELLGAEGLLIIDGDDPRLKKQFAGIMKKDILEGISSAEVSHTNQRLEEAGYKTQAHPREINFFYLEDDLRERIVEEEGHFQVLNTNIRFSRAELEEALQQHPEKFSPNVIMRPLYQECILPNLAYIGGGGELAYWMQLQSTFEAHHIPFPALILRNSALLIDPASQKRLNSLELQPEALFQPEQQLISDYVKKHSEEELSLDTERLAFEKVFEGLAEKAAAIDPTLKGSTEAEKAKFFHSLKNLESKLAKAEKRRFDTEIAQLQRLRQKLFPNGALQERHDNFMPFYLKYGPSFFSELKEQLQPGINKFQILSVS